MEHWIIAWTSMQQDLPELMVEALTRYLHHSNNNINREMELVWLNIIKGTHNPPWSNGYIVGEQHLAWPDNYIIGVENSLAQ